MTMDVRYPANEAEIASTLVELSKAKIGVVLTGGKGLEKFLPGDELRTCISTAALSGIVEHEDKDLTITCRAGTTIDEIRGVVGRFGQRLTVETYDPQRHTIGGLIAQGADSFGSAGFGPIRDQILGMRVVLSSGAVTKTGGRVVKNVTGYDLAKLYTGSRGTLGVITEVTLRLRAKAPGSRTFIFARPDLVEATKDAQRLKNLPCTVTGLAVAGGNAVAPGMGPCLVCLRVEGRRDTLSDAMRLVREVAGAHEVVDEDDEDALWNEMLRFPFTQPVHARIWIAPSTVAATFATFLPIAQGEGGYVVDMMSGRCEITLDESFPSLDQGIRKLGIRRLTEGTAIAAETPGDPEGFLRHATRFGAPSPIETDIIARLKKTFDPAGIMGAGRFPEDII